MTVRPLIEQWFPAAFVGAESARERATFTSLPPINAVHVWWARRPLVASRAAVLASVLPEWPEGSPTTAGDDLVVLETLSRLFPGGPEEYHGWFLKVIGILGDPVVARAKIDAARITGERLANGGYGYKRAFTTNPTKEDRERIRLLAGLLTGGEAPTTLDPFAGGGSIPLEAARLGLNSTANELNPVAAAVLNATVAGPARVGPEFASVIRAWGTRWAAAVEARLDRFYPREKADGSIVAYIWAHAVPCPTTGRPTPLAPDYWLARGKASGDVAIRVEAAGDDLELEVVDGPEAKRWGDTSTYKRGSATSVWTGETFGGDYIRAQAESGGLSYLLLAVAVSRPGERGRAFRSPTSADLGALDAAAEEYDSKFAAWESQDLIPNEEIPEGHKTDEPRRMGMHRWSDMFTKRQLLATAVALDELRRIVRTASEELSADDARLLSLYLSLGLDKLVDRNSRLSSWSASTQRIRNVFDRHDFAFKWSFAEFDAAHSAIPWCVEQVSSTMEGTAKLLISEATLLTEEDRVRVAITAGSATTLDEAANSVDAIITDPPYYDNVMYAECSDYFYVWLKRSLRDTWPELCTLPLTDKEAEAVANPSLYATVASPRRGRKVPGEKSAADLADEHYERLLTQSFREAHRVLRDAGVMTVMFTHKRVDAWDTLGQALLEAGFSINSSWPVHTEAEHSLHQAKKNAASSTIFLTCRKRGDTKPAYWSDIRGDVASAARDAADRFARDGMHGIDLTLSTFGPVLSVLSRNWPVFTGELDAEGSSQVLRPDVALNLAREEVARLKKRGLLGGRDVEFDRITDWYLLAWLDFAAAEFPSGEALKLSLATHLELDDLSKHHKVIRATSGSVTILTPAQRRTGGALDPDAAVWPTMLDSLHALMLTYEEDGLSAARAWMARTGKGDEPRFRDLVAAAIGAIPRTQEKGEFVRPEARTLEGLRATLFDDIEAPRDRDDPHVPDQGQLDLV